jgi:hypothetical protein
MKRQARSAADLLEIAGTLRKFASEATDSRYRETFRRSAEYLEIEALGCAALNAVAAAWRGERRIAARRTN